MLSALLKLLAGLLFLKIMAPKLAKGGTVPFGASNKFARFDDSVLRWRDKIRNAASDLPIEGMLAWIQIESDGFPHSSTVREARQSGRAIPTFDERGIFQIQAQEASAMGMSPGDFDAILNDDDAKSSDGGASIKFGIPYIRGFVTKAAQLLLSQSVTWKEADFWKLVKLQHAGSGNVKFAWNLFVTGNKRGPSDWNEFVSFDLANSPDKFKAQLERIFRNADKVGNAILFPPSNFV